MLILDKQPLQGISDCSNYVIKGVTSNASPLISDCQQIINNIQGTTGEWTTTLSKTRQLVQAGTCAFNVEEDTDQGRLTNKAVLDPN